MKTNISPELLAMYRKCRTRKPFMLVGRDAECSLRSAKTILAFRQLESDGLVRMRCEPEEESYFDVYGKPELEWRNGHTLSREETDKNLEALLELDGVWWTVAEWFDGYEWQQADSCGMHAGYKNPLDPFENCYVIQEMQSAIDALNEHNQTIIETQLAECCP